MCNLYYEKVELVFQLYMCRWRAKWIELNVVVWRNIPGWMHGQASFPIEGRGT